METYHNTAIYFEISNKHLYKSIEKKNLFFFAKL